MMEETAYGAKHHPFFGLPSQQSTFLKSYDPSIDSTHSQAGRHHCPAYHYCKELKRPYYPPIRDGDHHQQIMALHDMLQAIKEAALKLVQLIASDINERRKRNPDSQVHYPVYKQYERSDQLRSPGSEIILATTPSSVCALCGVALHLKDSSVHTSRSELKSKLLFVQQIASEKTTCQIYQDSFQQKRDNVTQVRGAGQHRYSTNETSKSTKLTQQSSRIVYGIVSSTISAVQDESTLTHGKFCPCACGMLVKDETKSELSIQSLSMLKEKLIKIKLEELGLYLDSKKIIHTEMRGDTQKISQTETQKLEKNIQYWKEVQQLELQAQVEELHESIRFFKQENEYIRCLVEKCRCLMEKKILQEKLPIKTTYSGFTTGTEQLQSRYRSEKGIMTTLTEVFRGSINIQHIFRKLLAPLMEHWQGNFSSTVTTPLSSTSRMEDFHRVP